MIYINAYETKWYSARPVFSPLFFGSSSISSSVSLSLVSAPWISTAPATSARRSKLPPKPMSLSPTYSSEACWSSAGGNKTTCSPSLSSISSIFHFLFFIISCIILKHVNYAAMRPSVSKTWIIQSSIRYCNNKFIHILKKCFRFSDFPILEHKTFSLNLTLKTYDNEVYCNRSLKHTF